MQLNRINQWFESYARRLIAIRWSVLLLLLAYSLFALYGLSMVKSRVSEESFFGKKDNITQLTDRFERTFGNNEQVAVLVSADDVFKPAVLQAIADMGDALLAAVPYADRVTSLASLDIAVGTDEGISVINPMEEGIPQTGEEIEAMRQLVMSRPSLVGKAVTADSTETWLALSLRAFPDEADWAAKGEQNPLYQVGEAAMSVLTDPKWQSSEYRIKPVGMPYTETEERDTMQQEMAKRVGAGFALMLLLLAVFLRSLKGVLVPAFTTIFGVASVFGMMGWLDFAVDSSMALLPVFLGMALSVGYSVHIVNAIKSGLARGLDRQQAVVFGVGQTGWPILFTALTTVGSMLSFLSAGILLTDWLAWVTSAVVLSVYLFVSILIPLLFSFGRQAVQTGQTSSDKTQTTRSDRFYLWLANRVLNHRKLILLATGMLFVISIPALFKIQVNMDAMEMMGEKVPYLKRIKEVTRSDLGSYINYNLMLVYPEKDQVKDPEILNRFKTLLDEVGNFELTKKNDQGAKVHSIIDVLCEINQTLHADDPAYYRIPETRELISQLLLLYEWSGGKNMYQWIDDDHRSLRANVEMSRFSANETVAEMNRIRQIGKDLFPDGELLIIGTAVRFAEMNNKLVTAELASFMTALLVIGLCMILVFGSIKTGLIGLLPNLAPVFAIGGLMGYAGFSLDMMTMTIMPMMLGIAVDDTIHFVNHIKLAFEQSGRYRQAIEQTFCSIGKNLAMTTIILSVAFGVFMTSPINMITRIGMMSALGLTAALIIDYLLTPVLIYLTQPFGPEKEEAPL